MAFSPALAPWTPHVLLTVIVASVRQFGRKPRPALRATLTLGLLHSVTPEGAATGDTRCPCLPMKAAMVAVQDREIRLCPSSSPPPT